MVLVRCVPFVDAAITIKSERRRPDISTQPGTNCALKFPFLWSGQLQFDKLSGTEQYVLPRLNAALEYRQRLLGVQLCQGEGEGRGAVGTGDVACCAQSQQMPDLLNALAIACLP